MASSLTEISDELRLTRAHRSQRDLFRRDTAGRIEGNRVMSTVVEGGSLGGVSPNIVHVRPVFQTRDEHPVMGNEA